MKTSKERRRQSDRKMPTEEQEVQIVYTPAKPFNRRWFLLRLATVAAVVLALIFGMSIFFKVQDVTVAGAEKYTEWEVFEASGIREGDALLTLNRARVTAKIRAALPYVGDVRVGIKLPGTVMIEIVELKAVYAIEDTQSGWWLMDCTGRLVDQTDGATARDYTRVIGVKIENPAIGQQAKAAEPAQTTDPTDPSAPIVNIPEARRLADALQVLSVLESNGLMDKIDTVDPTNLQQLTLWYGDQYQVNLGNAENLTYKVVAMKATIEEKGEFEKGFIDVSFTTWPDSVYFSPF